MVGLDRRPGRWFRGITFRERGQPSMVPTPLSDGRLILLALDESGGTERTLGYAMNACLRLRASLDIVHTGAAARASAEPLHGFLAELRQRGISYRLCEADGSLCDAVMAYVRRHPSVAFVVLGVRDDHRRKRARRPKLPAGWHALACPVVIA